MGKPVTWIAQGQWATNRGTAEVVEQLGFGIIGAWISHTGETIEQRELICRAVSSHVTMIEALEVAEATIERLNRHNSANGTLDVIRAAIAKAKGDA